MAWTDAINQIVERYTGTGGGAASAPADPHQDFEHVAQAAPADAVANGLSQAFRSDQTPPFAEMVGHLFEKSDPNQRAGLLNRLLGSIGPGGLSGIPGLGGLAGMLGSGTQITPQQASQITPGQVEQAAAHAEQKNPSIVDDVSNFYAQHPNVVKALGGLALSIAIQHMVRNRG